MANNSTSALRFFQFNMTLRILIFLFVVLFAAKVYIYYGLSRVIMRKVTYSSKLKYDPRLNWNNFGGTDAPDGMHTYQVSFQANIRGVDKHICSGTIVHSEWVVSAAYCFKGVAEKATFEVVAGSNKLSKKGAAYKVLKIYTHPKFNKDLQDNVAILKVQPIKFNANVSKIKVETGYVGGNVSVTLTGWGKKVYLPAIPDKLQHLNLNTTTVEFCKSKYNRSIHDSHICTMTKNGEGTCAGDRGSPLVQRKGKEFILTGISSWGEPCSKDFPDVYSRASSYVQWFNEQCKNCLNQK